MKVIITGGAGFLGRALARALEARGSLAGTRGTPVEIVEIVLFDTHAAEGLGGDLTTSVVGDIADRATVADLIDQPDVTVFHLASVVSHGAEQDFDLALRVNLEGGLNVLEACRALQSVPRVVVASSFAAYGGDPPPPEVDDATKLTPQSTYGMTKAVLELLINDYSRKLFVDGRAARLPTVVIRPGSPNLAASSWCSSVFREPLAGKPCVLPVPLKTRTPVIGARAVIDGLIRLHELDGSALGADRALLFPGLSVTAAEMVESVQRVGSDRALGDIRVAVDSGIEAIVSSWPARISAGRARELGFGADTDLDSIARAYIEDEGL